MPMSLEVAMTRKTSVPTAVFSATEVSWSFLTNSGALSFTSVRKQSSQYCSETALDKKNHMYINKLTD